MSNVFSVLPGALFLLLLTLSTIHVTISDAVEEVKGQLKDGINPLSRLPPTFSTNKLPKPVPKGNKCYPQIGCLEKFPHDSEAVGPYEMNAAFKLITGYKGQSTIIRFNDTYNCLKNYDECETYPFDLSLIEESSFDPKLRTVIWVGGWNSVEFGFKDIQLAEDWRLLNDVNFIAAAWTGGSQSDYLTSISSCRVFARQIVVLLYYLGQMKGQFELTDESYTSKVTMVGHSLGAHISGYVGKDLRGKIGQVIGLDPAKPFFETVPTRFKIDRDDALLVQVLHTNGGTYGLFEPLGHLDFYANNGKSQPECIVDVIGCSHKLAVEYLRSLVIHEIYLGRHLKKYDKDYHANHRLSAFKSDTFDEFQDGSFMSKHCPLVLDRKPDFAMSDITNCMVPIDFFSEPKVIRERLKQVHGLDLDSDKSHRSLFFYTRDSSPYLNNHYLIKLVLAIKPEVEKRSCDYKFELKSTDGKKAKHELKGIIVPHDQGEVYITLPFLSLNLRSKYDLALLDAHQFNYANMSEFNESIMNVFPEFISVHSSMTDTGSKSGNWFFRFFGGSRHKGHCGVDVQQVIVQPSKKLTRFISAHYSESAADKEKVSVEICTDKNCALPFVQAANTISMEEEATSSSIEVYLDKVLIGPLPELEPEPEPKPESKPESKPEPKPEPKSDSKPDSTPQQKPDSKLEPRPTLKPEPTEANSVDTDRGADDCIELNVEPEKQESSSVSGPVWFMLTVFSAFGSVYALLVVYKRLNGHVPRSDERCIISEEFEDPSRMF